MKTHSNRKQRKELSDAEFEGALHDALRDEGYLFPRNAEDVASLRAKIDLDGIPTPDSQEFGRLLHKSPAEFVPLPAATKVGSQNVDNDLEKLAIAARNGGEITEEIRKRMDADRARAKEQVQKNKNGTR
jgi:hypothetical protein